MRVVYAGAQVAALFNYTPLANLEFGTARRACEPALHRPEVGFVIGSARLPGPVGTTRKSASLSVDPAHEDANPYGYVSSMSPSGTRTDGRVKGAAFYIGNVLFFYRTAEHLRTRNADPDRLTPSIPGERRWFGARRPLRWRLTTSGSNARSLVGKFLGGFLLASQTALMGTATAARMQWGKTWVGETVAEGRTGNHGQKHGQIAALALDVAVAFESGQNWNIESDDLAKMMESRRANAAIPFAKEEDAR